MYNFVHCNIPLFVHSYSIINNYYTFLLLMLFLFCFNTSLILISLSINFSYKSPCPIINRTSHNFPYYLSILYQKTSPTKIFIIQKTNDFFIGFNYSILHPHILIILRIISYISYLNL